MKPVLTGCWFVTPDSDQYPRLAAVLEASARAHAPGWDIRIVRVPPPDVPGREADRACDVYNHYKLGWWVGAVAAEPDGARVLLVDIDTFVTGPLDPLWDIPFDVAYTRRDSRMFPLNAGVIGLRVNARSRTFMNAWLAADTRMRADKALHERWRKKYAGMNQASLGYVLEHDTTGAVVAGLPCVEWNCEDTAWRRFGPTTRIVHVKSALRMAVFGTGPRVRAQPLINAWTKIARAVGV